MNGKFVLLLSLFTSLSYAGVSGYEKITGNVEDISLSSSSLTESVSDVEVSYANADSSLTEQINALEIELASLTDEVAVLSDAVGDSDDAWTVLYSGTLSAGQSKSAPSSATYVSVNGSIYTVSKTTSQTLIDSYSTESCSSGGGGGGNVTCKTTTHYLYIKANKVYAGSSATWNTNVSIQYK